MANFLKGYIRLKQLLELYPVSKSTLYAKIAKGEFPRPIKLGPRISAWSVADIEAHQETLTCHDFKPKEVNNGTTN